MKDIKQPFYIVEFHFIEENCKKNYYFQNVTMETPKII